MKIKLKCSRVFVPSISELPWYAAGVLIPSINYFGNHSVITDYRQYARYFSFTKMDLYGPGLWNIQNNKRLKF